jgi:hypothetical protein
MAMQLMIMDSTIEFVLGVALDKSLI